MKQIEMRTEPKEWASKGLLLQVLQVSPAKALTVGDIRKRCKVLDALEKMKDSDTLVLEDDEHRTLVEAVEAFPWQVANKHVLQLIDDVVGAKAPAKTK